MYTNQWEIWTDEHSQRKHYMKRFKGEHDVNVKANIESDGSTKQEISKMAR